MIHKVCYISSCWSVLSRNYLPYNIWYWLVTCTLRLNDVKEVICMLYFWLLWDDKNNVINQISISFSLWLWKPCLAGSGCSPVCLLQCLLSNKFTTHFRTCSQSVKAWSSSLWECVSWSKLIVHLVSPHVTITAWYHLARF